MKENISREQFIKATYEVLSKEGIQALSIRRLGKMMDCNPANIYRYFTGLDELVLYASLQFLSGYLREVAGCFDRIEDSLKLHFAVWRCFAESSFEKPEIFDNLFFGKYSGRLDQIMREYYEIFPEEIGMIEKGKEAIFVNGDFSHRDYLMIENCVRNHRLSAEDARLLNSASIHLYKGYLKDLLDARQQGQEPDAAGKAEEFMKCLEEIVFRFVK
ncbi:TetR/AcrR family transcriptional regulator [Extibacter muris]|uniref:TetR/AcrR family transcriptional regulator n=1 Tax=Extibacter muris TaxID=1796622 RepID=UPI001D061B41|nr:TetR/AcrR family transcriptional regulator [Extibacter muris]MCB6202361.1 TetR/AcrR family transcriptional regulator [Extibacter muris]MCQ4665291.1 TetR/AcrR family transcriptional regulator [Extibacter muris]MCQ4694660.1 TetR/AcrR family transcriptional regulator [Extibacter muris]